MSTLNPTNGFVIHGWMVTELHLRGPELTTYAIVHQFSQSKAGVYKGGVPYIMAWIGCNRNSARKYLHTLEQKGLIKAIDGDNNGVPFRDYQVLDNHIPQILGYIPQKTEGDTPNFEQGIPQILTIENNIDINRDNNVFLKEKIVSDFFFRNWLAPVNEYERLVAYNSGPQVQKKWPEMTESERMAVARLWKPEKQQGVRFDYAFISAWRDIYQKLYGTQAPVNIRMAALDDSLRYDVKEGRLMLTIGTELRDYLEQHIETYKPIIQSLMKQKECKKLQYRINH
jgi:hypothetical protein